MGSLYSIIACTEHSGKEPHRQVAVGRVVTLGSVGGVMISTMALNARDLGSIPSLGEIFPFFVTSMTIGFAL